MAVIAHAEQNKIVAINRFAALRRQKIEAVLIFLGGKLRIDFASNPGDRFLRDRGQDKERFARHSEVALLISRRHAAFVAESEINAVPWKLAPDAGKLCVNRPRRISAGKCDPKLIAFGQGSSRLSQNEFSRFNDEVLRTNYVPFQELDRAV